MTSPARAQRPGLRLKGLIAAARILGVTRQHLRLVVLGKRKSPALLRAYRTLDWHAVPKTNADFAKALVLTRSIKHELVAMSQRVSFLETLLERAEAKTMRCQPSVAEAEARRDYFLKEIEREEKSASSPQEAA